MIWIILAVTLIAIVAIFLAIKWMIIAIALIYGGSYWLLLEILGEDQSSSAALWALPLGTLVIACFWMLGKFSTRETKSQIYATVFLASATWGGIFACLYYLLSGQQTWLLLLFSLTAAAAMVAIFSMCDKLTMQLYCAPISTAGSLAFLFCSYLLTYFSPNVPWVRSIFPTGTSLNIVRLLVLATGVFVGLCFVFYKQKQKQLDQNFENLYNEYETKFGDTGLGAEFLHKTTPLYKQIGSGLGFLALFCGWHFTAAKYIFNFVAEQVATKVPGQVELENKINASAQKLLQINKACGVNAWAVSFFATLVILGIFPGKGLIYQAPQQNYLQHSEMDIFSEVKQNGASTSPSTSEITASPRDDLHGNGKEKSSENPGVTSLDSSQQLEITKKTDATASTYNTDERWLLKRVSKATDAGVVAISCGAKVKVIKITKDGVLISDGENQFIVSDSDLSTQPF